MTDFYRIISRNTLLILNLYLIARKKTRRSREIQMKSYCSQFPVSVVAGFEGVERFLHGRKIGRRINTFKREGSQIKQIEFRSF